MCLFPFCRNCVENAFGILTARWRILLRTLNLDPKNVDNVVKASCVLHNFLMEHGELPECYGDKVDCFGNMEDGTWRAELHGAELDSVARTQARNHLLPAGTSSLGTSVALQGRCPISGQKRTAALQLGTLRFPVVA